MKKVALRLYPQETITANYSLTPIEFYEEEYINGLFVPHEEAKLMVFDNKEPDLYEKWKYLYDEASYPIVSNNIFTLQIRHMYLDTKTRVEQIFSTGLKFEIYFNYLDDNTDKWEGFADPNYETLYVYGDQAVQISTLTFYPWTEYGF